jgi:hypothetical protein
VIVGVVGGTVGGILASKKSDHTLISASPSSTATGQSVSSLKAEGRKYAKFLNKGTIPGGSTGNPTATVAPTATVRPLAAAECGVNIFVTHQDDSGNLSYAIYYLSAGSWKSGDYIVPELEAPPMMNTSIASVCWTDITNIVILLIL